MQKDPRTYAIIGAAMAVHRALGPGLPEKVYVQALCLELSAAGIAHRTEVPLPVEYRGQRLRATGRADIVCTDGVLLEVEATGRLADGHVQQVVRYLAASGAPVGLLLNFGTSRLEFRRVVASRQTGGNPKPNPT